MKNFGIQQPCDENWAAMTPTEKGAFCQQCAKQVIDFTSKSTDYIKATLLNNKNESLCGRITLKQELDLQNDFELWQQTSHQRMRRISLYAFILVFGLSIVSCADEKDKNTIQELHQSTMQMLVDTNEVKEVTVVHADEKTNHIKGTEIEEFVPMETCVEKKTMLSLEDVQKFKEIQTTERLISVTMGAMVAPNYTHLQYLEETTPTRLDENGIEIPTEFSALAYPNPTKGATTLKFEVPKKVKATIALYNMNGVFIQEVESRKFDAGTHSISLDLSGNEPGTYLIYIVSKEYKESLRVVRVD